jgi:hypothetical protein
MSLFIQNYLKDTKDVLGNKLSALFFYANNRENKPILKKIKIPGNVNVIQIQGSKTKSFEYWLRISTLAKKAHLCAYIDS